MSNSVAHAIIGTLSEGSVHRELKRFVDPDESHHEICVDGFVADVFNGSEITEIQTRSFQYLIPKLKAFTAKYGVTVVCPLIIDKLSVRIQKHTGEYSTPRKSPKKERVENFARDICSIADFIKRGSLKLKFIEISATEYRLYTNGRRGSVVDRVLTNIIRERAFFTPDDYKSVFLPESLVGEFTAKDYERAMNLPSRTAYYGIKLLQAFGFVGLKCKRGRAHIYEVI